MTLRSVNPYTSYQVLLDLQRTKDQMANLTEQLASGNRLTRLSDDPTASALVLNFQDSINRNKAYIKQADSATSFLQTTETALSSVNDAITRLREIGQRGLGSTASVSGNTAIAQEANGIKSNLLALANTQSQGKYIFAGTQTTTAPFTPDPVTGVVSYKGNQDAILLDVSASSTVTTNIPGDTAFFNGVATVPPTVPPTTGPASTGDLFTQIDALVAGLNTLDPVASKVAIQAACDNLKNIQGNINTLLTDVGGRQASLQQLTDNTESYNLSLQSIQSSYQAVDYPTAAADYAQAQTAQQAALTLLGKSNSMNLFNYLG